MPDKENQNRPPFSPLQLFPVTQTTTMWMDYCIILNGVKQLLSGGELFSPTIYGIP